VEGAARAVPARTLNRLGFVAAIDGDGDLLDPISPGGRQVAGLLAAQKPPSSSARIRPSPRGWPPAAEAQGLGGCGRHSLPGLQ